MGSELSTPTNDSVNGPLVAGILVSLSVSTVNVDTIVSAAIALSVVSAQVITRAVIVLNSTVLPLFNPALEEMDIFILSTHPSVINDPPSDLVNVPAPPPTAKAIDAVVIGASCGSDLWSNHKR